MLPRERRQQLDFWMGKAQLGMTGVVAGFGAILKTDPAKYPVIKLLLELAQQSAWIVVIFGPLIVAMLQYFRRRLGNPWAHDAMQKILNEFRDEMFGHLNGPKDHHRVTLFRHRKKSFVPPFSFQDQLVAVARSDHLTKNKIEAFQAPDDGEKCSGIVGFAYRGGDSWVIVPPPGGEPLPQITSRSSQQDIEKYASATFVDPQWVRKRAAASSRPLAGSYAALLVRVRGQPWGVLVIDSRSPTPLDEKKLNEFKKYGDVLTPILERI